MFDPSSRYSVKFDAVYNGREWIVTINGRSCKDLFLDVSGGWTCHEDAASAIGEVCERFFVALLQDKDGFYDDLFDEH